ncbi:MAG TPA: thioredoxin domain-containing protein [Deltaproteobacteria bacterium]|nr:thioredoxin domain-containing protein [Deltaproteobacteria bacterium]HIJ40328.1 thioredoxin domain-containing protein [Deltaproteobacteria bacterium]HIJ41742.1 thioredoxin domain-containing protein [Deltaproteobacteria bacterium]
MLKQYPETVKVVFKNFPLSSHRYAEKAAAAALAAGRQGKFWEFHDELFENYRVIDDKKISEIAGALKLDVPRFEADMQDPLILQKITEDYEEGKGIGVTGIPAIFINGKRVKNRSLESLKDVIEREQKKKGTP